MGISMGKRPNFEYHVGKWLKYDRFGSNSSQPTLGSPLNLGDHWRHTWKWPFWGKLAIFTYSGTVGNPNTEGLSGRNDCNLMPGEQVRYYEGDDLWFNTCAANCSWQIANCPMRGFHPSQQLPVIVHGFTPTSQAYDIQCSALQFGSHVYSSPHATSWFLIIKRRGNGPLHCISITGWFIEMLPWRTSSIAKLSQKQVTTEHGGWGWERTQY